MNERERVNCGRGDSNPHGIATASPSSWCVCQFRHFREEDKAPFERVLYESLTISSVPVPVPASVPELASPASEPAWPERELRARFATVRRPPPLRQLRRAARQS